MEAILLPHIKKGTVVYTIDDCKIEQWFVYGMFIKELDINILEQDMKHNVYFNLEKYNDGINSCKTTKRVSYCFLTKEELLKQL